MVYGRIYYTSFFVDGILLDGMEYYLWQKYAPSSTKNVAHLLYVKTVPDIYVYVYGTIK